MTFHAVRLKGKAKGHPYGNHIRIAVALDNRTFERLSRLAEKRSVPMAKVMREAIDAYLATDVSRETKREPRI